MVVTILAYKSDSESYCSDFQWKASMHYEEIAEFLAGLMFANKHLGTNEGGYEFTFLSNGEESSDWGMDATRNQIEFVAREKLVVLEADFQRKEQQRDTEERERQQLAQLQAKYAPKP